MPIYLTKNKIRAIRRLKKLRQSDLAKKIGLFQSELSEIETGLRKPNIYLAKRIAQALGEKLEELFLL